MYGTALIPPDILKDILVGNFSQDTSSSLFLNYAKHPEPFPNSSITIETDQFLDSALESGLSAKTNAISDIFSNSKLFSNFTLPSRSTID